MQFFCAIHPSMRPQWASRYQQLTSHHSESRLVCLEFPTYKEPSTGGPPFGVASSVYEAHLCHPGAEQPYDDHGNILVEKVEPVKQIGFRRIAHWQANRTHDVGKNTDWVSIWKMV